MPPEADHADTQVGKVNPPSNGGGIPKLEGATAAWLVLFVLGGGLLALYYSGIDYFPEFIWQDALTSLALMTIVGGGLLLAYGFLLFVPGAIWSKFLICDRDLHWVFWMAFRRSEHCVWAVSKHILLPFAVFMVFTHALFLPHAEPSWFVAVGATSSLVAVSVLVATDLREKLTRQKRHLGWHRVHVMEFHLPLVVVALAGIRYSDGPAILWTCALLPWASVVIFSAVALFDWNRRRQAKIQGPRYNWSLLCRATLAFASAALLSLAAIWFFYRVYSTGIAPSAKDELGLLLLCTVAVILANLIVSVLFHNQRSLARFVSFLVALVLLGAGHLLGTDPQMTLPAKIMANFGFGGRPATLVLTDKGGRLLCLQEINVRFQNPAQPTRLNDCAAHLSEPTLTDSKAPQKTMSTSRAAGPQALEAAQPKGQTEGTLASIAKPESQAEGTLARATCLVILSRLGSEYLLRDRAGRTFAFPKKEIVSWSIAPPQDEQTNGLPCQGDKQAKLNTSQPTAGVK